MESELFIVVCASIELGLPLIIMPDYKRCLYFKGGQCSHTPSPVMACCIFLFLSRMPLSWSSTDL